MERDRELIKRKGTGEGVEIPPSKNKMKTFNELKQNVIDAAIEWAEVNYLRTDLTNAEIILCQSVNEYLTDMGHTKG